MIQIYCRDQHGDPCRECQELMRYVSVRLDRCRSAQTTNLRQMSGALLPTDSREKIKIVMRYAGPRMMWEHPGLAYGICWTAGSAVPCLRVTPNQPPVQQMRPVQTSGLQFHQRIDLSIRDHSPS